jgi:hypothetical protein
MLDDREKEYVTSALDAGSSARVIILNYMGIHSESSITPHDGGDFARCLDILRKFPEMDTWQAWNRIATRHPNWRPVVSCWKELEGLFCKAMSGSDDADEAETRFDNVLQAANDLGHLIQDEALLAKGWTVKHGEYSCSATAPKNPIDPDDKP